MMAVRRLVIGNATATTAHLCVNFISSQQFSAGLEIGPARRQCQMADFGARLIAINHIIARQWFYMNRDLRAYQQFIRHTHDRIRTNSGFKGQVVQLEYPNLWGNEKLKLELP